jgi:hypothetical protein
MGAGIRISKLPAAASIWIDVKIPLVAAADSFNQRVLSPDQHNRMAHMCVVCESVAKDLNSACILFRS